jgi:tetratricopeptide (TPR) repeat protein
VRALRAYQQATKIDPLLAAARAGAGSLLLELGRFDEAIAEFRQILASPPAPCGTHALLVRALLARDRRLPPGKRDSGEIQREIARVAAEAPGSVEVAILQAETLLLEVPPREGEARRLLERARDAQPEQADAWVALAALARRAAGPREALRVLHEARGRVSPRGRAALELARLGHLAVLPPAESRAALMAAEAEVSQLPEADRPRLLAGLAAACAAAGAPAEASRLWEEVARRRPNALRPRLALFGLALRRGDDDAMERLGADVKRLEGGEGVWWCYAEASRLVHQARPPKGEQLSADGRRLLRQARTYLQDANRRASWSLNPLLTV